MIEYKLTRTTRKTIAIHVREGSIEVRAPLKTPKCAIDKFVTAKEKWIEDKLAYFSDRAKNREDFLINYGNYVFYRGEKYRIEPSLCDYVGFEEDKLKVPPDLTSDEIKELCIGIYRKHAKEEIVKRANHFANKMSVEPNIIKVNNAKSRWGSCSSKKALNFSWRLIMVDDELIDYVVVHELAHLKEMNHFEQFWGIVEDVIPDYRERKDRLKQLNQYLDDQVWD